MFEEGYILYFDPFLFLNGNTPKPKYFLVIKKQRDKVILGSLPTSHDHIPSTLDKIHGCIDKPEINFNCYYFKAGIPIASVPNSKNLFAFPLDTYIYGYRIDLFETTLFEQQMADNQSTVEVKGKLHDKEYTDLLNCLRNSTSVKRKFKKLL